MVPPALACKLDPVQNTLPGLLGRTMVSITWNKMASLTPSMHACVRISCPNQLRHSLLNALSEIIQADYQEPIITLETLYMKCIELKASPLNSILLVESAPVSWEKEKARSMKIGRNSCSNDSFCRFLISEICGADEGNSVCIGDSVTKCICNPPFVPLYYYIWNNEELFSSKC